MSQFFYTRKEVTKQGEETVSKEYRDSFNVNKVIRTVEMEDNRLLVLLDDFHERVQEVPDIDLRNNKMKGTKRQRDTFQSEIYLSVEDKNKFYEFCTKF